MMRWRKSSSTSQTSDCGNYSVCRVTYVTETGPEPRYEAYRTRNHPDGLHCLAVALLSGDEAKARCQDDAS